MTKEQEKQYVAQLAKVKEYSTVGCVAFYFSPEGELFIYETKDIQHLSNRITELHPQYELVYVALLDKISGGRLAQQNRTILKLRCELKQIQKNGVPHAQNLLAL